MPSTWDWPLEAPVSVKVKARPFNWPDAWLLPTKPVAAGDTTGPTQDLVLIPYGKSLEPTALRSPALTAASTLSPRCQSTRSCTVSLLCLRVPSLFRLSPTMTEHGAPPINHKSPIVICLCILSWCTHKRGDRIDIRVVAVARITCHSPIAELEPSVGLMLT
jgi:hypothetical protein